MPEPVGNFVGESDGIADAGRDKKPASGNANGTGVGEVINGYSSEEPATERINTGADATGTGTGRRTRRGTVDGRTTRWQRGKSGADADTPPASVRLDSFTIGGLLVGIHAMLAEMTNTPQLEITAKEGESLGNAVQEVAKQYNHEINPKTAAWVQLCVVAGGIYGTRIASMRIDAKVRRHKKVVQMPSPPVNDFPEPPTPQERPGDM